MVFEHYKFEKKSSIFPSKLGFVGEHLFEEQLVGCSSFKQKVLDQAGRKAVPELNTMTWCYYVALQLLGWNNGFQSDAEMRILVSLVSS